MEELEIPTRDGRADCYAFYSDNAKDLMTDCKGASAKL